jgi:hypothetical protein
MNGGRVVDKAEREVHQVLYGTLWTCLVWREGEDAVGANSVVGAVLKIQVHTSLGGKASEALQDPSTCQSTTCTIR